MSNFEKYSKEIKKYGLLSEEEEKCLRKKLKNEDLEARDKLITSNLQLVLKLANRYKDRGVEFEELVCEGNKGLITATMKFNPKMDNKFSTYAYFWIKQAMLESIEKNNEWNPTSNENVLNYNSYNDTMLSVDMTEFEDADIKKTKVVLNLIDGLPKRDSNIIKHFFGISGFSALNTIEISKKYNITTMRVSTIIDESLRKIRCKVLETI